MSRAIFVKPYEDPIRCATAAAHYRWLASLESGVRLPHLYAQHTRHLVFERLPGHTPKPVDLPRTAATLGRLHAAAYRHELHAAQLNQPHTSATGLVLPDFASPRRKVLHGAALATGLDPVAIERVLDQPGLPVAFYKDPNLRNYLVDDEDIAVVDFDDLTLAPFGYDLAGLLVTSAMTHGRLDAQDVLRCLDTYNAASTPRSTGLKDLQRYAELHHLLTLPYLGRNGYRYPWPTVRPWPEPFGPD
ncbi:phosphotransferase [Micromonospora sp. NPDC004704]